MLVSIHSLLVVLVFIRCKVRGCGFSDTAIKQRWDVLVLHASQTKDRAMPFVGDEETVTVCVGVHGCQSLISGALPQSVQRC